MQGSEAMTELLSGAPFLPARGQGENNKTKPAHV
jgi:hypothetical protein